MRRHQLATTDPGPALPSETAELAGARALFSRTGTAERVAGVLRTRIAEGFFPPGPGCPRGT